MGATMRAVLLAVFAARFLAGTALGEGSEGKGAEPIQGVNLAPKIKAVADLKSRVYWREVNGDFFSVHKGEAAAANEAIRLFEEAGGRDVVLWPAPGKEQTFSGDPVPCDFTLHVPGGLAVVMLKSAKTADGKPVFELDPTLTIFVSERLKLDALKIPGSLKIVELSDIRERYAAGLKAGGKGTVADSKTAEERRERTSTTTIRAQSAYQIGMLWPIASDVVPLVRDALRDPESNVRICAISALGQLGSKDAIPDLENAIDAAKEAGERDAAKKAIADIRLAKAEPAEATQSRIKAIHMLRASR